MKTYGDAPGAERARRFSFQRSRAICLISAPNEAYPRGRGGNHVPSSILIRAKLRRSIFLRWIKSRRVLSSCCSCRPSPILGPGPVNPVVLSSLVHCRLTCLPSVRVEKKTQNERHQFFKRNCFSDEKTRVDLKNNWLRATRVRTSLLSLFRTRASFFVSLVLQSSARSICLPPWLSDCAALYLYLYSLTLVLPVLQLSCHFSTNWHVRSTIRFIWTSYYFQAQVQNSMVTICT